MTKISARARRDGVRSALALMLASVSGLAMSAPAFAQDSSAPPAPPAPPEPSPSAPADAAQLDYDIPAQPLASALVRFAEQARLQILFNQADVAGLTSRALKGRYGRDDALALLLPDGAPRLRIVGDHIARLSDAEAPLRRDASAAEPFDENVVVTGSRIRGAHPAGSNVLTLDRTAIDASGAATVQGALATLPQVFPGVQSELSQFGANAQKNISFGSAIDLRGLGSDATLTLLDGRRLAPAGSGNFVDVSMVPLVAVDRIEVLADGASAAYGSDAVGGVVNIILRRDFSGAQTDLRWGGDTHGELAERVASQIFGRSWASGNFVAGYEYRDRSHLDIDARDFTRSADLRPWGGQDFTRTSSNPGNITRIGSTSTSIPIPSGQDGTALSQSQLVAGPLNRQEPNQGSYLLPDQTSQGFFFNGRHRLFDHLEAFVDLLASRREAYGEHAQVTTTLSVPQTNYYRQLNNLFPGQGNLSIAYFLGDDLGPSRYATTTDALASVAGLAYEADNGWRTELSVAYSKLEDHLDLQNNLNTTGPLTAALAASDAAHAFNPFADGSNTPQSVLDSLVYTQTTDNHSEIGAWALKADGPLFSLWGGSLRAALGVEQRNERFRIDRFDRYPAGAVQQFIQKPGERTTNAYFLEVFAPLLSPENQVPFVHALSLSASVRREEADGVERSTTPRLGLNWSLSPDLALRGSWGHSFKAPQFQQTLGSIGGTLAVATAAQDPYADNGATGVLILLGSNGDLKPERAETWTAGVDWTPRAWSPFSLHATYFNIDFKDRITTPGSVSAALRNPAGLEGVFFRDPSPDVIAHYLAIPSSISGSVGSEGIEAIFDGRLTNLASLDVRGLDLSLAYSIDTRVGTLDLFASASRLLQETRRATPAATAVDLVGTIGNPIDWRGRFGAALGRERWSLALTGNYTDDYTDNLSLPNRRIASLITWDALVTYDLGQDGKGPRLTLSVQNLFDEEPPFANNSLGMGFDSANFSPIDRFASIALRQRW